MLKIVKSKIFKEKRIKTDKVLPFLYFFDKLGIREVSITELLDAIQLAQEKIEFGYTFSERVFYSPDVFEEIDELRAKGYVKKYSYQHDGYFPQNYVTLTPSGFKQAKKSVEFLSEEEKRVIQDSVSMAIERLKNRYKLWRRKLTRKETFSTLLKQ